MIPAMESFCIFAGFGVLFIFFAMISLFIAGFSIDQNRMMQNKNIFCSEQKNWKPNDNSCSQKSLLSIFFKKYARLLVQLPFKVVVVIVTLILVVLGSYGISQLHAEFRYEWFLEDGTYLRSFYDYSRERYPNGISGAIWVADVPDIHTKLSKTNALIDK